MSFRLIEDALQATGIEGLLAESARDVLAEALSHGGALAELFFESRASTRVAYEGGRVDQVVDGTDRGVGLRVIFSNRSVYGYTTDLSVESLLALARSLAEGVRAASGTAPGGGADSARRRLAAVEWKTSRQADGAIAAYRIARSPRALPLRGKIDIARRIDAGARAVRPDARQVMAVVMDAERRFCVINSDGLVSSDRKDYFHMVAQVVGTKDGRVESAYETDGGYVGLEFLDQVSPESIGSEAARRVSVLLDARPAPAGTMPVVLAAEAGGTMVHEAVGHGLEADLACNGLSVYQNKLGQQVASPLISVVDDGTMTGRRGSYAFDDEGTASRKNVLIENGVLKSYMVDRLSAMKFDLMATGNGRRETYRHKPIVRMTNTYIAPGKDDPARILAETPWGLYVKAIGGGQVNTVTGDFVFGVTEGYLIRDGRIGEPIRGATLVGNGPRVLSIVDRLGSDLGFATGTCGKDGQGAPVTDAQPTMRIPELTVGGEVPKETYWAKQA